jgi:hypothetical protein
MRLELVPVPVADVDRAKASLTMTCAPPIAFVLCNSPHLDRPAQ